MNPRHRRWLLLMSIVGDPIWNFKDRYRTVRREWHGIEKPPVKGGRPECHPDCVIGENDHPGYLAYRCMNEAGDALPFDETDDLRNM